MKNSQRITFASRISLLLCVAQLLLIIGSWMVNALWPQTGVRSLLSSEGVRWFFGHFVDMMATPPVVWLLLMGIACGLFRHSRLHEGLALLLPHLTSLNAHHEKSTSRLQRVTVRHNFALFVVIAEFVAFVVLMALLTMMPQSLLLSASGTFFPSSFSASIVPYVAFALGVMSVSYGLIVGTLPSLSSLYRAACQGLTVVAPWLLLSVFIAQFVFSLLFVFGRRIPFIDI